jgi:hypothetical protein
VAVSVFAAPPAQATHQAPAAAIMRFFMIVSCCPGPRSPRHCAERRTACQLGPAN